MNNTKCVLRITMALHLLLVLIVYGMVLYSNRNAYYNIVSLKRFSSKTFTVRIRIVFKKLLS